MKVSQLIIPHVIFVLLCTYCMANVSCNMFCDGLNELLKLISYLMVVFLKFEGNSPFRTL